jgi:hypothetical protein
VTSKIHLRRSLVIDENQFIEMNIFLGQNLFMTLILFKHSEVDIILSRGICALPVRELIFEMSKIPFWHVQ